jgi:hypothetical protein
MSDKVSGKIGWCLLVSTQQKRSHAFAIVMN